MTSAEVDKMIREACKKKSLSLAELDSILEDDAAFDVTVDKINECLDDSFVVELPCDLLYSGNGGGDKIIKNPPLYSSGTDFYFRYINELRKNVRMDRDDEYLFSKRLEFFKRRLIAAINTSRLTDDEILYYFQHTTCSADTESADITPLCEKLVSASGGRSMA